MKITPLLRNNLLTMARAYAALADVKLSTVSRMCHGDPPWLDNLAAAKPVGFTTRKYDDAMDWFRTNWPENQPMPKVYEPWEELADEPRARRLRRRRT